MAVEVSAGTERREGKTSRHLLLIAPTPPETSDKEAGRAEGRSVGQAVPAVGSGGRCAGGPSSYIRRWHTGAKEGEGGSFSQRLDAGLGGFRL